MPRGVYFHYIHSNNILLYLSVPSHPMSPIISGILGLQNIVLGVAVECIKESVERVEHLWTTRMILSKLGHSSEIYYIPCN